MPSRPYSLLTLLSLAIVVGIGGFFLRPLIPAEQVYVHTEATSSQPAAVITALAQISATTTATVEETVRPTPQITGPTKPSPSAQVVSKPEDTAIQSQKTDVSQVARVQNPYAYPALSFDAINTSARSALVNILCMPRGGGSLHPISGSGVIIDPRGVILTNAHVAQYVLLSEDPRVDLSCEIRTGNPATARWQAEVLYLPPIWIQEHAADIMVTRPTGTGEHDYALLQVTANTDGTAVTDPLPYLRTDTREAIAFLDDQILAASYPAEFVGGLTTRYDLFPATSITAIKQLMTFNAGTVDVLSLGGIIEAQGGSSGGAVVNQWGRLVGIIVTTSDGDTTGERDLRALALSYIDRDIKAQSGASLQTILDGDVGALAANFNANVSPVLLKQLISYIDTKSQ
jgi:hypothetical protein